MKSNVLVIFCLLLSGCSRDPSVLNVRNLNPSGDIGAFGHGGMGIKSLWPIDSFESLTDCIETGADGSEMDVQLSKDSILFLYHAATLDESTHCGGRIIESYARDLDCEYKSIAHKGTKLCRFEKFLQAYGSRKELRFTFEIKLASADENYYRTFASTFVRTLNRYGLSDNCFIESTSTDFLKYLRLQNPDLNLFLYSNNVSYSVAVADSLNLYGVTFDMDIINREQVDDAHRRGLHVTLFNQQSENDNIRAVQMSPDFIQTDKIEHLLTILGKNQRR